MTFLFFLVLPLLPLVFFLPLRIVIRNMAIKRQILNVTSSFRKPAYLPSR